MGWVKLHDDILSDPKLMRAARSPHGQGLVLLPWFLAFASKAADRGRLSVGLVPAEPEDLAYQIPGVTAAQVESALLALVAIGVLKADEDGCLMFAKWESRQAKPSTSKSAIRDRVAKHRNKKKGSNTPKALQGVTPPVTEGVTEPEKADVTPCNATDKKRGEEKRGEAEENSSAIAEPAIVLTRRPRPPRAKEESAPWMGRLNGVWKGHYGGNLPTGSATLLRPVVGDVGEEEAASRLDTYLDSTDAQYVSLRQFAAKHGAYANRLAVDPETGIPNAIGIAALGGRR
jgi:hypothetical protein